MARRYKWPPAVVANMTIDQQLMYFEDGVDSRTGRSYVRFETMEEYMEALNESR